MALCCAVVFSLLLQLSYFVTSFQANGVRKTFTQPVTLYELITLGLLIVVLVMDIVSLVEMFSVRPCVLCPSFCCQSTRGVFADGIVFAH